MNPYESLSPQQPAPKPSIISRIKKVLFFLLIVVFFTGCFTLNNKISITDETTFSDLNKISLFHGLFVYPMSRAIILMHKLTNSTLFAIISITIINRFIGFAFSFKATIEGEKMKEIQPLINSINVKYAQRTDRLSNFAKQQEIQELFKKYQINPLSVFATILVSLPLFMGIYAAVKDNTYIKQFDLLGVNAGSITSQAGFNVLIIFTVLFLIISQYISIKIPTWLTKIRAKGRPRKNVRNQKDPTNTMALIFPLLMFFISWSSPISILVYFTVSPIFTIFQSVILHQYLVKKELKEKQINKPIAKK